MLFNSSAFNGMNSMAGFNTMSHGGNHVGGAAMTPVTPIATPTVPMTHAAVPNGPCIQQRDPTVSSYSCMSRAGGYDISLGPYNRHGSMGLGHNPMGPSATSVAMATATHNYHQSVNSQYAIHNSHNSTGNTTFNLFLRQVSNNDVRLFTYNFRSHLSRRFRSHSRSRTTEWATPSVLDSTAVIHVLNPASICNSVFVQFGYKCYNCFQCVRTISSGPWLSFDIVFYLLFLVKSCFVCYQVTRISWQVLWKNGW